MDPDSEGRNMNGLVVLHEDVQIVPLLEIPEQIRGQLGGQDGDFALTRLYSRNPSKVIDASAASLLRQFRTPRTIVEGILAWSKEARVRAADVLEEAYPLIETCLRSSLLVEPGAKSEKIQPSFAPGDAIDGNIVERPVQALVDSEVYQVRTPGGRLAVLKIATPNVVRAMERLLTKEACVLRHLGGAPAPEFLQITTGERPWLLAEWFDGEACDRNPSVETVANILDAYAALHERGVIHGDVHPRNILVSASGEVRIIDFGISHLAGMPALPPPRAGVAFFFEPEYAQALRNGSHCAQTFAGEQFSIASLAWLLLCGHYYTDFSFDKDTLLRQIVEDKPLPFDRRGVHLPTAIEAVVMRALSKDPADRFPSVRAFADAFRRSAAQALSPAIVTASESKLLLDRVLSVIAEPGRIPKYNGPAAPTASVTYGQAGVALAAHRIACARDDGRLLALADAWAERAAVNTIDPFYHQAVQITPEIAGRISPWHTPSGVAAVQALIATARGDELSLDSAVSRYLLHTEADCDNPDLTLGRAGVLLGLTLLLEANGSARPPQLMGRGNQICGQLLNLMNQKPDMSYLGIAHGWAGLLYAVLRWFRLTESQAPAIVEARLQKLAAQARFTTQGARWPVQTTPGSLSMPGWCNGSAGYVFLWTLAGYSDLAAKAALDAFEGAGGGHALCCGFAGQAYAQLTMYNFTGDRVWLERARTLAEKAAATGNRLLGAGAEGIPHSLYKGDIGVAVLIAELEKPETAAMPFFESPR
jgi:serine/threonine-protein kinase